MRPSGSRHIALGLVALLVGLASCTYSFDQSEVRGRRHDAGGGTAGGDGSPGGNAGSGGSAGGDASTDGSAGTAGADAGDAAVDTGAKDAGGSVYAHTILADGPIAYYRLDESGGSVAADSSGNGYNAAYIGTFKFGVAGALANDPDTAVGFVAANHCHIAQASTVFDFAGTAPYTFEVWVNPSLLDASFRRIISKENNPSTTRDGYELMVLDTSITAERWGGGHAQAATYSTPLPLDTYSQVAMTFDGTVLRLYVNGYDVATGSSPVEPIVQVTTPLTIGEPAYTQASDFAGAMDELAIYDKALTGAQIMAHYQAGLK